MTSMSRSLFIPLLVLSAVAFVLLTARPASAAIDMPWSATGTGSVFVHDANPHLWLTYSAGPSRSGSWNFSAVAATSRPLTLKWSYDGTHAWYQVSVSLERYVKRGGIEIASERLVDDGPVNCCAAPSGNFLYRGETTFVLQQGDVYGFRMTGSNFDSNPWLEGTLVLTGFMAPSITPVVDGTQGPNGYYTGPTTVKWKVDDNGAAISSSTGCADTPVTEDTHGKTFTCIATNRNGTSVKSVTIKRDATAPGLTVPSGLTLWLRRGAQSMLLHYTATATDLMDPAPALTNP